MGVNISTVVKSPDGNYYAELAADGLVVSGFTPEMIDTEVVETVFDQEGLYLVTDSTNENSAFIKCHLNAGSPVLTKDSGATSITVAKDTAASLNVYFENDVLNIQNLTGGTITVAVRLIG